MILLAAFLALTVPDRPDISAEPACRPAETIETTVAEIGRNPGRFVERCVRVSGILYHGVLHDDRASLYLARLNSVDGGGMRSNPEHHLWISGQARQGLDNETPVSATVVGRIDTCAQRERRSFAQSVSELGPDDIYVGAFHCYAANGQMIAASEVELGHRAVERVAGESARARFGNLTPMPPDWSVRPAMESVVEALLAALRAGDREQAAAIHGFRPGSRDAGSLSAYLFDDPDSPFAPFRGAAPSQIAWFVPRLDDMSRYEAGDLPAIACFCRTRDCSERWPISSIDIRHQPGRPYACTRVLPREWVPSGAELETDVARSGPVEPMRTAAR